MSDLERWPGFSTAFLGAEILAAATRVICGTLGEHFTLAACSGAAILRRGVYMERVSVLDLTLMLDDATSFTDALDSAGIAHSCVHTFSTAPQASGLKESITAVSEAMPWNAIAKVIVTWIKARSSREVLITTKDGQTIHAKGYSAQEIRGFLLDSRGVMVVDTDSNKKP